MATGERSYKKKSYKRKLFDPAAKDPFRISRSKVDLFVQCPRCCYLDLRLGIARPSLPGFTLNIAVDHLFKKEFDIYRKEGTVHPLMKEYGIDAVPFQHPDLSIWRTNFTGIERHHSKTNITFFGAVDDIWVSPSGELSVVDYKATSKKPPINLDEGWGPQYKRQIEFYQWLLRGKDLPVSDTGYFVYANGIKDRETFDNRLDFAVEIITHTGSGDWIERALSDLYACLLADVIPPVGERCDYCPYREGAGKALQAIHRTQKSDRRTSVGKSDKEEATRSLF